MSKKRRKKKKNYKKQKNLTGLKKLLLALLLICGAYAGYDYYQNGNLEKTFQTVQTIAAYADDLPGQLRDLHVQAEQVIRELLGEKSENVSSLQEIPEYNGQTYVTVNGNEPVFTDAQRNAAAYERYSELDYLGRCGFAEAKISKSLMPTEERGAIGAVKPSGWHTVKYDNIDGLYLYNRCHLIGYQLTGENANEKNLITGTRYLNVEGMLPWENLVADYIQETGDMVLYRVTPVYRDTNLVASGVQMEAESLGSDEIRFNIFVFNVQPGIGIDYSTGDSWKAE